MKADVSLDNHPQEGDVVLSLAGHDRGRTYLVMAVSEDRLWLTDGRLRPWDRPKQKSHRHCQLLKRQIPQWTWINEGVREGSQDSRVREALLQTEPQSGSDD